MGVEFLEKIMPECPDIVKIVLTGYNDMDAIINAINKGPIFHYIRKPCDETELRIAIEDSKRVYKLKTKNKHLVRDLQNKVSNLNGHSNYSCATFLSLR